MLHHPNKDCKGLAYCGPTAISSITKAPISYVRSLLKLHRMKVEKQEYGMIRDGGSVLYRDGRKKPVTLMYSTEMTTIMTKLNRPLIERGDNYNKPMITFFREYGEDGDFLMLVKGHVMAVANGLVCDTMTLTPITFDQYINPNVEFHKNHKHYKPLQNVRAWFKF